MNTLPITNSHITTLYKRRKREGQDLVIYITDSQNRRGTGKTVLSLKLAQVMDTHGMTEDNTTMKVKDCKNKYVDLPNKSALVFDEIEAQADKYRQGSAINRALNLIISMGRIHEKYLIFNAPSQSEVDNELLSKGDIWISVVKKGLAKVHYINWHEYEHHLRTPIKEYIKWRDLEDPNLKDIYKHLTKQKEKIIQRGKNEDLVTQKEVEKKVKKAKEDARRTGRDETIKSVYDSFNVSHRDLADALDLSKTRITEILNQ